ncbi:MAG: hypothetical protein JNM65_08915 [Verrucomicrobiaceae bacterium]|nr:hypothetical protein [Verrucomicrobiaceae bacterium]
MKIRYNVIIGSAYLLVGSTRLVMAAIDSRPTKTASLVIASAGVILGLLSIFIAWKKHQKQRRLTEDKRT